MRREGRRVALVGLVGCVGAPAADTACVGGVELGTGTDTFERLAHGQELPVVYGPQGGYHLPLALLGCGVGDEATSHVSGTGPTGSRVVDVTLRHVWYPEDACCGHLLDVTGYVLAEVGALDGQPVALRLEATDAHGTVYVDERTVVVTSP